MGITSGLEGISVGELISGRGKTVVIIMFSVDICLESAVVAWSGGKEGEDASSGCGFVVGSGWKVEGEGGDKEGEGDWDFSVGLEK